MSKQPARNSDINSLSKSFRKKFDPRRAEVKKKYSDAEIFEARRTQERHNRLYGVGRTHSLDRKPVTRTLKSKHLEGNAVDVIFSGKREGPYDDLIAMAKRYGIRNLKPKETCHFEDDGTPYNPLTPEEQEQIRTTLAENSKLWNITKDQKLRDQLKATNTRIRNLYISK